ncbi:KH domain-containing protein [Rhabdothermincola sp.]|uniref:KH domain-containing protein n=1 Tax=Rhabdothermincola sp. TaxID=2820405 RepID=UPI002FDF1910
MSEDRVVDAPGDLDDEIDDDEIDGNRLPAATARAVLEYLVRQIVDDPDAVEVEIDERGRRPTLNVHVAQGDMGRVIGKRGRVAQSIRTVVRAAAARGDGVEVEVEFVD